MVSRHCGAGRDLGGLASAAFLQRGQAQERLAVWAVCTEHDRFIGAIDVVVQSNPGQHRPGAGAAHHSEYLVDDSPHDGASRRQQPAPISVFSSPGCLSIRLTNKSGFSLRTFAVLEWATDASQRAEECSGCSLNIGPAIRMARGCRPCTRPSL